MLRNLFSSFTSRETLDSATQELLQIKVRHKELEIETNSLRQQLEQERSRQRMLVEQEQHQFKLELTEKEAEFARQKKYWEEDKKKLISETEKEKTDFKHYLEKEYKLKIDEAVSLLKLDSEQRIKRAELDAQQKIQDLQVKHAEDISAIKQQLTEENYSKLSDSLAALHEKGNASTQFIQEMALKMMDRGPSLQTHTTRLEVGAALPAAKGE